MPRIPSWSFVAARLVPFIMAVVLVPASMADPWPHSASNPLLLASKANGMCIVGAVPDLSGGARFFCVDPCTLYTTVPTQTLDWLTFHTGHVRASGDLDADGVVTLPLVPRTPFSPSVFPDSAAGAYLVWVDERNFAGSGRDLYAHHVLANGQLDPAFPAGGRAICTAPGYQQPPLGCSDGQHGVILAWNDRRDSATTAGDIYAAHLRADGTLDPAWPANGRAISTLATFQQLGSVVADGSGGALIVYSDGHTPANSNDIYVKHVLANGTLDPAWAVNGALVAGTTTNEVRPLGVTDLAGGAFVAWESPSLGGPDRITHVLANGTLDPSWPVGGRALDYPGGIQITDAGLLPDIHGGLFVVYDAFAGAGPNLLVLARHLTSKGASDPTWPVNPVVVSPDPTDRFVFQIDRQSELTSDGAGGLFVVFQETPIPSGAWPGFLEQHILANGTVDSAWPASGRALTVPPSTAFAPIRVPDGAGGEILFMSDPRDTLAVYAQTYAQRIGASSLLGADRPFLSSIRDVPGDQGGRASVFWYAPARDTIPSVALDSYAIWRLLDGATAASRAALPASAGAHPWRPGEVRATPEGAQLTYWEFLGQVPARGSAAYALVVPTRGDSTAAGAARETYEVDAHLTSGLLLTSPPDSGYSVDNLAPAPPTPFTGTYAGGTSTLHWQRNVEPDLAGYRLYRGAIGFTPAPGNLIASPTTPDLADAAGRPYQYVLTAIDVHGNESAASRLVPTGALGVDDAPRTLAFTLASASPASTAARFAIALPVAGRVRVRVYDAAGRLMRTVVDGVRPAGTMGTTWDLCDEGGNRVAAGLFVAVLDAAGGRREQRLVVIR